MFFLNVLFDPDYFSIAKSLIPPTGVFFDLGANHGLCTFGLLPDLSAAQFHLFEANESLVRTIEKSTALYKDSIFFVNHACISDEDGHSKFHLENAQSGQSHVATQEEEGVAIKNLVLDSYCKANKIGRIDFAKIDLEGHELSALKAGNPTCETTPCPSPLHRNYAGESRSLWSKYQCTFNFFRIFWIRALSLQGRRFC